MSHSTYSIWATLFQQHGLSPGILRSSSDSRNQEKSHAVAAEGPRCGLGVSAWGDLFAFAWLAYFAAAAPWPVTRKHLPLWVLCGWWLVVQSSSSVMRIGN